MAASDGLPDEASEAALEGTKAHEWLEAVLTDSPQQYTDFKDVPDDMWAAVSTAVDYVREILADYADAVMLVEHAFDLHITVAPGEVWGTCDIIIYIPSLRLLYVIDYKHGAGVYVEVKGNYQERFYGLGALTANPNWKVDTVALVIIQPRIPWTEPIREEWLPVEEILNFGPVIAEAIVRCKAPNAPLVPGQVQCQWCAVRVPCPARQQRALIDGFGGVQAVQTKSMPMIKPATDEELGLWMSIKDDALSWFSDVEKETASRLHAGRFIPGQKLVEAQARRQWEDDSHEAAKKLGEIAGTAPDIFMSRKLKGLTEVETLLKKGQSKEEARRRLDAMAFLTTKKSSGALKVAPESDPRPAVNRAASAFAGVAQIEHIKDSNA